MIKIERTTVIVDLENACGGSHQVPLFHREVLTAIKRLVQAGNHLTIYSTGPKALELCPELLFTWSGARYVQGRGIDGADNALLDVISHEPVASRSSRLVLVSGDHAFTQSVADLRSSGIQTTVVSRPQSLARNLAQVADEICWLPDFPLQPIPPDFTSQASIGEAA